MSALAFELESDLEAHEPPEARGISRDGVRLLVARRSTGELSHHTFRDLPDLLAPGDVVVLNVSATLPAAVPARRGENAGRVRVHFATRAPHLDDEWRVVEIRSADGRRPARLSAGERLELRGGAALDLVAPYASGQRLMLAKFCSEMPVDEYLERYGEPIRYGHVRKPWPLDAYQNVYATSPGSAEMPSAGRPFTRELLSRLFGQEVVIAPITLHAGVSSPESHEPPFPEWFEVPERTAQTICRARGRGGRIIAVGTTVVRALESAATAEGCNCARSGWTGVVITPECGVRTVDGMITGWHEPEASHLQMLEAVAGPELLERSYRAALEHGYLWHEFGDSHLILP
jgi:S-adenosylmethionine:tRNA ribosyltransferase-isomerase